MSRFDNPGVKVTIRADWRDYGPVRDGIPEMHYRFRVKRPGKIATEDARAKDELEAKLIVCRAFGWYRRTQGRVSTNCRTRRLT